MNRENFTNSFRSWTTNFAMAMFMVFVGMSSVTAQQIDGAEPASLQTATCAETSVVTDVKVALSGFQDGDVVTVTLAVNGTADTAPVTATDNNTVALVPSVSITAPGDYTLSVNVFVNGNLADEFQTVVSTTIAPPTEVALTAPTANNARLASCGDDDGSIRVTNPADLADCASITYEITAGPSRVGVTRVVAGAAGTAGIGQLLAGDYVITWTANDCPDGTPDDCILVTNTTGTLNVNVASDRAGNPILVIGDDEVVTIPACEDDVFVEYFFTVVDNCEPIDPADVIFDAGGTGLTFQGLADDNGTSATFFADGELVGNTDFATTVMSITYNGVTITPRVIVHEQEDAAPFIIATDENVTIPQCEDEAQVLYSFTIVDQCGIDFGAIDGDATCIDDIQLVLPSDVGQTSVTVHVVGTIEAPGCLLQITYKDQTATHGINVVEQEQQPAAFIADDMDITAVDCSDDIPLLYAFNITGACEAPSIDDVVILDDAGLNLEPFFSNVIGNTLFVEYFGVATNFEDGSELAYFPVFGYEDLVAAPSIVVRSSLRQPYEVIADVVDVTINECVSERPYLYGFNIVGECEAPDPAGFTFIDGGAGLTLSFANVSGNSVYLEYIGTAFNQFDGSTGAFFPAIIYVNDEGAQVFEFELPSIVIHSSVAANESQLACNPNVNITMDDGCDATITPAMLMNSNTLCPDVENSIVMTAKLVEAHHVANPMQAEVEGAGEITVNTPGKYKYTLSLGEDECWGYFTIEDKSAPVCAPAGDKEPDTYVCDSAVKVEDPSGYDDLYTEFVSHVVIDMYGKEGIEPWFDVLDAGDFQDCSDMANVEFTTTFEDFCDGGYAETEEDKDIPKGWEVCMVFERTWTAYDWKGNEVEEPCSQLVKVLRPRRIQLDEYASGECGHDDVNALYPYFIDLPAGYTCPQTAGKKIVLEPGKTICKWNANVELGNEIELCTAPGGDCSDAFKQVNVWTIIDLCSYDTDEREQTYLFKDELGPHLDINEVSVWTNPFDCTTSMTASFSSEDYCSDVVGSSISATYEIEDEHGNVIKTVKQTADGSSITLENVPLETEVSFEYSAWDCCGNMTTKEATANSWDNRAPVCIANDELEVGLIPTDHDGIHSVGARIYPEDLDDTSKDNCFPLKMEIRKVYADGTLGDWSAYVEYSYDSEDDFNADKCTDIQWVDLRVTEIKKDGSYGLSTVCQSKLTLRDGNAPKFDALADKKISCLDHADFDTPSVWGFCLTIDYKDSEKEYHCPEDGILSSTTRTWTASKMTEHGMSSDQVSQTIYVYEVRDEEFAFPLDVKLECSSEGVPAAASLSDILTNKGCSEWVMDVTEQTFLGEEDACYKILRKYTFINWCDWDENNVSPNYLAVDKDDFDLNNDGKLLSAAERATLSLYGEEDNDYLVEEGYFTYTQVIKVSDSVDPTGSVTAKVSCDPTIDACHQGVVSFDVEGSDLCSEATFTEYYVEAETSYGDDIVDKFSRDGYTVSAAGLPTGTYTIHARIDDSCGNFIWVSATANVDQADCKKPTVIGYANFTALMENCTVDIWLSDILASSDDNCSEAYGAWTYGMELANDGVVSDVMPTAQSVTITTAGGNQVALWMKDGAGNTQYTFVPVVAQDNAGNCTGGDAGAASVIGKIVNENNEDVDQVTISAKGTGMVDFTSIFDGSFNVTAVPMHSDVTISAAKNVGHLNGVSTADLVLLQRHVLGISSLNSAYKIIAADANNDTKIDTRDMLHISRLVLGIYDELPNNSSWRFVSKAHTFANPTSPWGFAEAIDFQNLEADAQADFIGIKVGDLTGNAVPSNLLGSDDTKVGAMTIAIDEATIAAGETATIDFTTADFNNFAGYQFSIALDSRVAFNGVSAGTLEGVSDANFGLSALESGVITTNWSNVEGVSVENGTVMFSLTVTASENVKVSEILAVNSAVTAAEAYNSDLDVHSVGVQFNRAASATFELFQNTPNPVSGETVIGFNLPTAGQASLKVMDVAGRTIAVRAGTFAAGYNTIALNKSDLGATGVLYYQLDTENNSATKKMVILE